MKRRTTLRRRCSGALAAWERISRCRVSEGVELMNDVSRDHLCPIVGGMAAVAVPYSDL